MSEPRVEAIVGSWIAIAVVFAGLVASWVVLREMATNTQAVVTLHVGTIESHERRITKIENDQTIDRKIDKLSWQLQQLQETVNELPQKKQR